MGGLTHLAPLQIQPEQQPDPVSRYGQLQSIAALGQQEQQRQAMAPGQLEMQRQQIAAAALDNQQKTRQLQQAQAMDKAFQMALTPDPQTGRPTFDQGKVMDAITASGNGSLVPQLTSTFQDLDTKKATLLEKKTQALEASQDYVGSLASEVKAAGYTPASAGIALAHFAEVDPQSAAALKQQFAQNPDSIKQWVDQAIAGSPKQREVAAQEMASQARRTQANKQPNETGAQADQEYQDIVTKQKLGQQLTPQELATKQAYEQRKTIGPRTTFELQNSGIPPAPPQPAGATPDDMYKSYGAKSGVVKAIVEGRQSPPSGFAQKTPYWQDVMQKVYQVDPEWSEQRAQVRKAFTTGTDGRNIGALNTAAVHLDALDEAGKALENGTFRPGNQAYNYLKTAFGGSAPTTFEGIRNAVSGEMASALKGNATDAEIAQIKSTISSANSPKQLSELVNSQLGILGQKLQTYKERFEQQLPGDTAYSPVLPSAQAVFQKHQTGQQPQSGATTGKAVSLAAAKQLPAMKGETDDEIRALIQAQGHTVAP